MKKSISLMFVLLLLFCLSACTEPTTYTDYPQDGHTYSVGEQINIYDKESSAFLGCVTVTGITVVRDEPFALEKVVDYDENNQETYEYVHYEAVVQIDYNYQVLDSTNIISPSHFLITDCEGNPVERSPQTDYEPIKTSNFSMFVGVKEKGEYLNIKLRFHSTQEPIAEIKAVYDGNSVLPDMTTRPVEYETPPEEPIVSAIAVLIVIAMFLSPVAFIVLVIIAVIQRSEIKALKRQLKGMQGGPVIPMPLNGAPVLPYYPPYPCAPQPVPYPQQNVQPVPEPQNTTADESASSDEVPPSNS